MFPQPATSTRSGRLMGQPYPPDGRSCKPTGSPGGWRPSGASEPPERSGAEGPRRPALAPSDWSVLRRGKAEQGKARASGASENAKIARHDQDLFMTKTASGLLVRPRVQPVLDASFRP